MGTTGIKVGAAALLVTGIFCSGASAQDAKDFYEDETLTFVVGFGPGGGFDTYARLLAPHVQKRLGGTVIVENRPGAGGTAALNQMVRGDQDGSEINIVHGEAALLTQLTGQSGRRFDAGDFNWLGRIASEPGVVVLSTASPYKTLDDLKNAKEPIKFSAGSKADGLSDYAAVFCETLQLNCKIVTGYKGSKESSLAAIRGETDAIAVEASSAAKYSGDEMTPLLVLSRDRTDVLPDTPTIFEATDVPEDRAWWIDFRSGINKVGRSIAVGPEVPADRVAYLREAVGSVLTDPDVIAEGAKINRGISYLPPEEQEQIVTELLESSSGERLGQIKEVLLEKYF